MAEERWPCGCMLSRSPIIGAPSLRFPCTTHLLGPPALALLIRLARAPRLCETIEAAQETEGEVPGSTFIRQLQIVLLAVEEHRETGILSADSITRLKNALLLDEGEVRTSADSRCVG